MEVLRSLVYTPVALAIQAEENEKIIVQLRAERLLGKAKTYLSLIHSSKVIIVEFFHDIAEEVCKRGRSFRCSASPNRF